MNSSPFLSGTLTLELVDGTRQAWTADRPRPLTTQLWYPVTQGEEVGVSIGPAASPLFLAGSAVPGAPVAAERPLPLVLLSHGTGGAALQLAWLGTRLAARGYVVAAVNHHGNTGIEPYRPEGFVLLWERVKDLSAVLDQLLAHPTFGPAIDGGRIGAAGFSAGGYTVLSLAGARLDRARFERLLATAEAPPEFPDLREAAASTALNCRLVEAGAAYSDPRVKAVLALAPALGEALTDDGVAGIGIPISIVVGGADAITPADRNARRYAEAIPGARLTVLPGVGHYTFLAECTERGRELLPQLCRDAPGTDRRAVHERVAGHALDWFEEQLPR